MAKLEKKKGMYCSNIIELPAGTNSPSSSILAEKQSGEIPSNISKKKKKKKVVEFLEDAKWSPEKT